MVFTRTERMTDNLKTWGLRLQLVECLSIAATHVMAQWLYIAAHTVQYIYKNLIAVESEPWGCYTTGVAHLLVISQTLWGCFKKDQNN